MELNTLKKKYADQKTGAKKNALADWELRYAKGKLDLKEKHYTVHLTTFFTIQGGV